MTMRTPARSTTPGPNALMSCPPEPRVTRQPAPGEPTTRSGHARGTLGRDIWGACGHFADERARRTTGRRTHGPSACRARTVCWANGCSRRRDHSSAARGSSPPRSHGTSASVAVSDSNRISLRTVKSRRCSRGEVTRRRRGCRRCRSRWRVGEVQADVDLPVRVGDLVDDLHRGTSPPSFEPSSYRPCRPTVAWSSGFPSIGCRGWRDSGCVCTPGRGTTGGGRDGPARGDQDVRGTARQVPSPRPAYRRAEHEDHAHRACATGPWMGPVRPEEVDREYRRRSADNPVDYALLLLRTPQLFVEAKGISRTSKTRSGRTRRSPTRRLLASNGSH